MVHLVWQNLWNNCHFRVNAARTSYNDTIMYYVACIVHGILENDHSTH
jgi:hypothetical protein